MLQNLISEYQSQNDFLAELENHCQNVVENIDQNYEESEKLQGEIDAFSK